MRVSDGRQGHFIPSWPIHCFQAMLLFFPSSLFFFRHSFLSTKASLMHFIPGALTLDGASLEENRAAAAEGETKIEHKPVEGNLK